MAEISEKSKKAIERWIAIQRYGSGSVNKAHSQIDALITALLKEAGSPRKVMKIIRPMLKDMKLKVVDQLLQDLADMSEALALAEHKRAMSVDPNAKLKPVTKAEILSQYRSAFAGISTTTPSKSLNRGVTLAARSLHASMDDAINFGYSKSKIKDEIKAAGALMKRHVETSIRSATNGVANYAYEKQYQGTNIDRVMWVSTLDHRTSPFCQAADGKVFRINQGPRPPAHHRCRSTIVVIAKGESPAQVARELSPRPAVVPKSDEELKRRGIRTSTGRPRKPSRTDRSPLKGTTVRNTTYETWLKSQSALYQDKILGTKAAKRFRSGDSLVKVLDEKNSALDFSALSKALN